MEQVGHPLSRDQDSDMRDVTFKHLKVWDEGRRAVTTPLGSEMGNENGNV